jgi:hypothetical protein
VGWKLTTSSFDDSRQGPRARGGSGPRHIRSPKSRISRHGRSDARVIAFRHSTVVRVGTGAAVVAALALGFAIGSAVGSQSPAANTGSVAAAMQTPQRSSSLAFTGADPTTTPAASSPVGPSCGPDATRQVRPTRIYIDCARGDISISDVSWSSWGPTGGSGSGTLNVNDCLPNCATASVSSTPAFVVVSDVVSGMFQRVVITPPSSAGAPQSSARPGSGWGSG